MKYIKVYYIIIYFIFTWLLVLDNSLHLSSTPLLIIPTNVKYCFLRLTNQRQPGQFLQKCLKAWHVQCVMKSSMWLFLLSAKKSIHWFLQKKQPRWLFTWTLFDAVFRIHVVQIVSQCTVHCISGKMPLEWSTCTLPWYSYNIIMSSPHFC